MMTTRARAAAGVMLLFTIAAAVASAQTNAEINAGIQFNFSYPGARSLGLGSAFVGLADDATAAYTNPAGLTVLAKPEVSLEGRQWRFTNAYTDSGHGFGTPSGIGIDGSSGLRDAEDTETTTGASFASFVYPKDHWAFAVYRHELANFEAFERTRGAFLGEPATISRLFPAVSALDLDIVNYGVSVAYRFGEKFSAGVGLSYYDFSLDSATVRHSFVDNGTGPGGFYGPASYGTAIANTQTQHGDDNDWALNVGLLWRASSKFSLGAVYRQGPDFPFSTRNVLGDGTLFAQNGATFHVPDVFSAGIAYRPTDELTLTLDYDRVQYRQLTHDFVDVFGIESQAIEVQNFKVDSANEYHGGIEYIFTKMKNPLALRAGAWLDPDHRVRFEGADLADRALFRGGSDEVHYSAGIGMVFGAHFQVDAAADLSDGIDVASLSMVARF